MTRAMAKKKRPAKKPTRKRPRATAPSAAARSRRRSGPPRDSAPYRLAAYANDVATGKLVTGKLVALACRRHLDDLADGKHRGLWFDAGEVDRLARFFQVLRHSKGRWAGERFSLEPWQLFLVGSVFGWKRDDGRRRFRNVYAEICRKNGKSTIAAGVAVYGLGFDGEPGAEVYTLATKRDQAKLVWNEAKNMIFASPDLRRVCSTRVNLIEHPPSASKLIPLGRDADSLDGLNVHLAVIDEMHQIKNRELVDVVDTATGARRQPLLFQITTAGARRLGVCFEARQFAERILEGFIANDQTFAYVATIDDADDWTDPACWIKANPNLGVTVDAGELGERCAEAKDVPERAAAFQRYRCGRWIETVNRAIDPELWKAGADPALDVDALVASGRRCFAGVDLSSTKDLSALALFWPASGSEPAAAVCFPFCPARQILERSRADRVPYSLWRDQGYLTATDLEAVDQTKIVARVAALKDRGAGFSSVGADPWNAQAFLNEIESLGLEAVKVRQGHASLSAACKHLETLILSRRLRHNANPVLDWAAGNLIWKPDDNENLKPDKAESVERIDPIVALIIAIACSLEDDAGEGLLSLAAKQADAEAAAGEESAEAETPRLFLD